MTICIRVGGRLRPVFVVPRDGVTEILRILRRRDPTGTYVSTDIYG